ncbi:D-lactate ferricytochrome c oxidoreductase [Tieghemiomyces parasiticus]|uniref:D-lactate ferricytochrome c oxidoreductase n=1 Tax=Tieghemiomyces parasiticus TaxID=78921 RepID=A0A9W8DXX3_9FUNG|nr:D-lactate ferricytochrome c oxidoreductase [Tieghemiomyces parasiticus]
MLLRHTLRAGAHRLPPSLAPVRALSTLTASAIRGRPSAGLLALPRILGLTLGGPSAGAPRASFSQNARDPVYKLLAIEDVQHFRTLLGPRDVITTFGDAPQDAGDTLASFNTDWTRHFRGQSQCVLRPRTTEQVSQIMQYCHQQRLAVVPQGGNTGLNGGGIALFDEVVLSLGKMDQVRTFDPVAGTLVCDAGCILQTLDAYLEPHGYTMPLDLAAKGSCQIGGNVSTNAGGVHFIRHGSLHGNVLGLEVVLADGTVLHNLTTLAKDNTGYDLKHLFIGAEGTLGIVTGVAIKSAPLRRNKRVAVLGVSSMEKAQQILALSRTSLAECLSAFELWDDECMETLMERTRLPVKRPLADRHPFYLLVEISSAEESQLTERVGAYVNSLVGTDLATDGVLSQDQSQFRDLWNVREALPMGILGQACLTYDFTFTPDQFYSVVPVLRERLTQAGLYQGYQGGGIVQAVGGMGHFGDGNIHVAVALREQSREVTNVVEPFVYKWTAENGGSISAEHGLGLLKVPYLRLAKPEPMIQVMRQMKAALDPLGILNPYKVLPPSRVQHT